MCSKYAKSSLYVPQYVALLLYNMYVHDANMCNMCTMYDRDSPNPHVYHIKWRWNVNSPIYGRQRWNTQHTYYLHPQCTPYHGGAYSTPTQHFPPRWDSLNVFKRAFEWCNVRDRTLMPVEHNIRSVHGIVHSYRTHETYHGGWGTSHSPLVALKVWEIGWPGLTLTFPKLDLWIKRGNGTLRKDNLQWDPSKGVSKECGVVSWLG